jgi:hypothetical protein
MPLPTGLANNPDSIFRDTIIENSERATVESATRHRGSASEIVVDRGPVVKVQPVSLLSIHDPVVV